MENWIPLSDQENKKIWKRIYKEFKFKPSISKFPSFKVPSPFITYDISNFFGEEFINAFNKQHSNLLCSVLRKG